MALAGTHIRFALDVRGDFGVVDQRKYISGSVYPDSRYPAGIDRDLTHGDNQMEREFWHDDDFRKGWASHLLYDHLQTEVRNQWFADILQINNPDMTGEEDWVVYTALKLLQDINDVTTVDIKPYLAHLEYVETPNGEDEEIVQTFNDNLALLYNNNLMVNREAFCQIVSRWTLPNELIDSVIEKAEELSQDPVLLARIHEVYDETMRRKDAFFAKYCV